MLINHPLCAAVPSGMGVAVAAPRRTTVTCDAVVHAQERAGESAGQQVGHELAPWNGLAIGPPRLRPRDGEQRRMAAVLGGRALPTFSALHPGP